MFWQHWISTKIYNLNEQDKNHIEEAAVAERIALWIRTGPGLMTWRVHYTFYRASD